MPRLSVWAVRAALVYLAAGATIGALVLVAKGGVLPADLLRLLPMHQEFMMLGWLLQLAIGVGYWILPRLEGARPRPGLAVLGIACLNGGILGAAIGGTVGLDRITLIGRLLELGGAVAFIAHVWARVRLGGLINRTEPRSHLHAAGSVAPGDGAR
jgi:hypothetical protein